MAFTFTDANVKETIATGQPVIDELAKEYEGRAIVGKYNVDEENDFCTENGVRSLPTLLFFKDGQKTALRLVGGQKADAIRAKIDELIAL